MDKKYTDELFKKILENPPHIRPSLEALEDMNHRLDMVQDKRKGILWWWLLPLLLLPFIASSIYFYNQFQTAKKTINELNLQLSANRKNESFGNLSHTITTYKYDTIFNTVYQDVIIKRQREESKGTLESHLGIISSIILPNFGSINSQSALNERFNTFDISSIQPSQLELLRNGKVLSMSQLGIILSNRENDYSNSNNNSGFWNVIEKIEKLSFLDNRFNYQYPLPLSDHFLTLSSKREKDNINPLWYFVPTGFEAGISWNPIGIAKLPGTNNTVKSIGILGEITFTKNTRLQFGLDYLKVPLKVETSDELSQFPSIIADNPGDLLKELYGNFSYLQVPLTLKYVFQPDKKWNPSIGVGMIARLPINEQFKYEFVSIQGGEYDRIIPYDDGSFSINNISGKVGLGYNFYKNYTIQAEGYYNYQFGKSTTPYFNLNYYGLNLNLKYKF